MKIHHLNCGCMCPLGGAFYDGFSKGLKAHLVCHCLLIETDRDGLVIPALVVRISMRPAAACPAFSAH
ncbi:hypothetical protein [Pantoea agglomerans]|uniref:hypothetical protein n=1 Tax=Enterobacter agglomerans TaxID=549 RepID=UPI001FCE3070|nr:hypothetical protein [Pantoea agglomerans]